MKLDILAFAAHPDDTELACAGTLASHIARGKKVGVVDFTRGELGTRGSAEIRDREAAASAEILKLSVRDNLNFRDGFFVNDEAHKLEVIRSIRTYRPEIILANATYDRHPDHGRASQLVTEACFLSGLAKIAVMDSGGNELEPWRPRAVYHYIQSIGTEPDFIVDISDFWDVRVEATRAFKSQFHDPNSTEEETYISSPEFMKLLEARAKEFGHSIGAKYGEGFTIERNLGVKDLFSLQ